MIFSGIMGTYIKSIYFGWTKSEILLNLPGI